MTFINDLFYSGEMEIWRRQRNWNRNTHQLNYLFWEATVACNFKCKHCGSAYERLKGKEELTTKEALSVFTSIAEDFDPSSITVAITGGEPLVRKDLVEVGRKLSELGFGWGLVTNGYLMNKEMARDLVRAGMKTVVVSIDDIGNRHDVFRGVKGAYEHAIRAIRNLSAIGGLKDIQITTTVTAQTVDRLEDLRNEFLTLPITSWRVMAVSPIGRAKKNHKFLLTKSQIEQILTFILETQKSKSVSIPVFYGCENYLGKKYEAKVRPYYFECRAGINVGSILYNGDIFVCPNVPRTSRLIQGNVRKERFSDVWNTKFEYFRNTNLYAPKSCSDCKHWNYCEGGSRHLGDNPCFMTME